MGINFPTRECNCFNKTMPVTHAKSVFALHNSRCQTKDFLWMPCLIDPEYPEEIECLLRVEIWKSLMQTRRIYWGSSVFIHDYKGTKLEHCSSHSPK